MIIQLVAFILLLPGLSRENIPTLVTEAGILPPVAGGGGVAVVLEVYEALAIARWIP
jgi:hypothetical protein